ncbi:hypothetical protein ACIA5D_33945 [Actinoplanes sp. NPDC051513]|uniref:hypothetical protein n=1 Tax=Actinoplanes sp. NPDC051513 TaxID=3363908 RepID=UPI0037AB5FF3
MVSTAAEYGRRRGPGGVVLVGGVQRLGRGKHGLLGGCGRRDLFAGGGRGLWGGCGRRDLPDRGGHRRGGLRDLVARRVHHPLCW